MRYTPDHKERTHRRIVKSASRQFRREGVNGPGVAKLMKASGLTHGGFYKHFASKDDLFAEAIDEAVRDVGAKLTGFGNQGPPDEFWKEIVRRYLSIEHCEAPGMGCPVAALAPDISRTHATTRRKIRDSIDAYRKKLVEFMPGDSSAEKQKNFALIFSSMVGALTIARTLTDRDEREKLLGLVRNHLLSIF